jgi:hypothetical protein
LVTERERSGARNGVGKVVVPAGRVVDAVPTAARRPAFKPAELGHEARMRRSSRWRSWFGAPGAVAQSDSNGMSVDSIMRAVPQAPVGHRQPRRGDVPLERNLSSSDVPYEENLWSGPISKEDAILDKKMKSICRGC